MDLVTYLTTLRLIHIVTGVFWAGSTCYLAWFVFPASRSLGPEGGKFMQQLANTRKLPIVMSILSALNIISGALLLWELSGGLQSTWMSSKHGLILIISSALAVIAFVEGITVTRAAAMKMTKIGEQIASKGGPPTHEQLQQLTACRNKIGAATNFAALLLLLSAAGMSIVKYL